MLYNAAFAPTGSAVRVAVEDRERADERGRERERRPPLERDRGAEQDRRRSDADFGAGEVYADEAEKSAECHHERECDRQHPQRRRTELRTPQSDRDHRRDVVES
jgi:hypothetical protein